MSKSDSDLSSRFDIVDIDVNVERPELKTMAKFLSLNWCSIDKAVGQVLSAVDKDMRRDMGQIHTVPRGHRKSSTERPAKRGV